MKIRIKGNSLRLRLSKSDVDKLARENYLEEQTHFPGSVFIYSLKTEADSSELSADYVDGKITVHIPVQFVKDWPVNEVVGISSEIKTSDSGNLYLLVEKDFVCLDETMEDQSDNYDNPKNAD